MKFWIRMIEKEDEAEKETADDSAPKLDLKFKEGQTIKVNLNITVSNQHFDPDPGLIHSVAILPDRKSPHLAPKPKLALGSCYRRRPLLPHRHRPETV